MSSTTNDVNVSYLDYKGKHSGLLGWILSVDHKRIGILYLVTMLAFFAVGVTFGFLMRLELIAPGRTIMDPQTYNSFFTLHGIIMIFLFIIPGLPAVFGNFFLPIMLGAADVAFPRLNLMSWWLFLIGGILAVTSVFLPGGAPDTGWTFYIPYSVRTSTNVIPALMAAFVLGFYKLCSHCSQIKSQGNDIFQNASFYLVALFHCLDSSSGNSNYWYNTSFGGF